MVCPYCKSISSKVVDSRTRSEYKRVDSVYQRRRECNNCHKRYNTFEVSESDYNALKKFKESREAWAKILGDI